MYAYHLHAAPVPLKVSSYSCVTVSGEKPSKPHNCMCKLSHVWLQADTYQKQLLHSGSSACCDLNELAFNHTRVKNYPSVVVCSDNRRGIG